MKQQDRFAVLLRVARAGRTRPVRGFAGGVVLAAGTLREAAGRGLFEGAPVFFKHAREDGRDVRDMAGVLAGASFDEGERAVLAELHPFSNRAGGELAALVGDLRRQRVLGIPAPDVGVSLDAFFVFDRAVEPPLSRQMTELVSVDIVFRPAADGRILAEEGGGAREEGQGAGYRVQEGRVARYEVRGRGGREQGTGYRREEGRRGWLWCVRRMVRDLRRSRAPWWGATYKVALQAAQRDWFKEERRWL
jgi:hypothetical protein